MKNLEKEFLVSIENELKKQISECIFESPLAEAVEYVLFPGGKRIRPLFSLFLAKDFGVDITIVNRVAVLVEYIHAASLIHDDLPAMDNDDFRRGKPSCHKAFPEATAILCGDALTVLPYTKLNGLGVSAQQVADLTATLSQAFIDLCNGQQLDLSGATPDNIEKIFRLKTGALFAASAKITAICAGFERHIVDLCSELGYVLGVYFQVIDDYIDALGVKGRPTSSDEKNSKVTSVNIDNGKQKIQEIKDKIDEILEKINESGIKSRFEGVKYIIDRIESVLSM